MRDSPTNINTMIQIAWPGAVMTLRCVGAPSITEKGIDKIRSIVERFSSDCQMMLVWISAALGRQGAIPLESSSTTNR